MKNETTDNAGSERRVNQIIAAYLEAERLGKPLDREELLRQHPDLAAPLQSFFADKDRFNTMAKPIVPVQAEGGQAAEALTIPPSATPTPVPGTTVRYFGDYELLEEIARGGMGVVYKARQVSLNRIVALKMILTGQLASAAEVRRFRTEAEAAAALDHPNIVPIYEVGQHDGQHYFSMRLIEGSNLSRELPRFHKDPKAAAKLLLNVARAVYHAHQRGILHRDLKPANILLDAHEQPLVTDFGLAKRVETDKSLTEPGMVIGTASYLSPEQVRHALDFGQPKRVQGDKELTQSGVILGTASYMPPEQARAEKILTPAVDVFSLGAILYEMLTGRRPFKAGTTLDTLLQVLEAEPERPGSLNSAVDHDLERICLKCLRKKPQERYESAAALAADLERWLAGKVVLARLGGGIFERTVERMAEVAQFAYALGTILIFLKGRQYWFYMAAGVPLGCLFFLVTKSLVLGFVTLGSLVVHFSRSPLSDTLKSPEESEEVISTQGALGVSDLSLTQEEEAFEISVGGIPFGVLFAGVCLCFPLHWIVQGLLVVTGFSITLLCLKTGLVEGNRLRSRRCIYAGAVSAVLVVLHAWLLCAWAIWVASALGYLPDGRW